MKRIVSILLIAFILVAMTVIQVFAETESNTKITYELQKVLDMRYDDDEVNVVIRFDYEMDDEADAIITQATIEKCGYELSGSSTVAQIKAYEVAYEECKAAYCKDKNTAILESLGITTSFTSFESAVMVTITKAEVEKISQSDLVTSIEYNGVYIEPDENHLYESRFLAQQMNIVGEVYTYDEITYHDNEQGDMDWVLVYAQYVYPDPMKTYVIVGDRVAKYDNYNYGSSTLYWVYDVSKDEFLDIMEVDFNQYDGLEDAIYAQQIGVPIGDADKDSKFTVLDATFIQRVQAQLDEYDREDSVDGAYVSRTDEALRFISDFDRDGERTVMDATAIQMKLAGIEA
ncbi:MAG: hypothetical protein IKB73_03750 [Ruminococcus sp.]|nr:hypothetical protein [Ruminococcus sp.]